MLLKLRYDGPLSNFAFNFTLRRCIKAAQDSLAKKQKALGEAQAQLKEVLDKVQVLKDTYETSTAKKQALDDELADLELKLDRAEKLVNGWAVQVDPGLAPG